MDIKKELLSELLDIDIEDFDDYCQNASSEVISCEELNHFLNDKYKDDNSDELYDAGVELLEDKEYDLASIFFLKSSNLGNKDATYNLGCLYMYGDGVAQNDSKAFDSFMKAYELGCLDACPLLANMFFKGNGTEKDYVKAFEFSKKAGEAGDVQSILRLGYMYEKGYGVEQDDVKALKYYLKASELGTLSATFYAAIMYETGRGAEKNESKAFL